tara:strand:- start:334 stop:525 length:192 start_codon:yes stop_codon:yes gene_type:complete
MACLIINPHITKNLKPIDLCSFPWEKKIAKGKIDTDPIYKKAKFMDKIQQKIFKKIKDKENAK